MAFSHMKHKNTKNVNAINQRNKAAKRLAKLKQSAELLQQEIEVITNQLEHLDTIIHESTEENGEENTTTGKIQIGDRVEYNKKAGKRLKQGSAQNPRSTVTCITDHYI